MVLRFSFIALTLLAPMIRGVPHCSLEPDDRQLQPQESDPGSGEHAQAAVLSRRTDDCVQ